MGVTRGRKHAQILRMDTPLSFLASLQSGTSKIPRLFQVFARALFWGVQLNRDVRGLTVVTAARSTTRPLPGELAIARAPVSTCHPAPGFCQALSPISPEMRDPAGQGAGGLVRAWHL